MKATASDLVTFWIDAIAKLLDWMPMTACLKKQTASGHGFFTKYQTLIINTVFKKKKKAVVFLATLQYVHDAPRTGNEDLTNSKRVLKPKVGTGCLRYGPRLVAGGFQQADIIQLLLRRLLRFRATLL